MILLRRSGKPQGPGPQHNNKEPDSGMELEERRREGVAKEGGARGVGGGVRSWGGCILTCPTHSLTPASQLTLHGSSDMYTHRAWSRREPR